MSYLRELVAIERALISLDCNCHSQVFWQFILLGVRHFYGTRHDAVACLMELIVLKLIMGEPSA